jgi:WD40 repeat protein
VQFVRDGTRLVTASGVAGSGGIATLWEVETGERIRDFKGHRDLLYDAEISPDGTILATCGYDRRIILWDVETGEQLRSIEVHNGAVYDLAFSPDGSVLASASADDTCKLWRVSDGTRLDTLGQPLKEQYSVTFSPDGRFIAAGGADNRIRIWRFVSKDRPRINPLVHARFAHEGPIVRLAYTPDGEKLISVAEDRTIKVWETKQYTELKLIRDDVDVSMTLAVAADSERFFIGRMDGSLEQFRIPSASGGRQSPDASPSDLERSEPVSKTRPAAETTTVAEQEPNDSPAQAQPVTVPAKITGVIHNEEARPDEDFFRFSAKEGEEWVIEVDAARSGSPLDSVVEVLTTDGQPIERVLLQAVRDSYFTFRGRTPTSRTTSASSTGRRWNSTSTCTATGRWSSSGSTPAVPIPGSTSTPVRGNAGPGLTRPPWPMPWGNRATLFVPIHRGAN